MTTIIFIIKIKNPIFNFVFVCRNNRWNKNTTMYNFVLHTIITLPIFELFEIRRPPRLWKPSFAIKNSCSRITCSHYRSAILNLFLIWATYNFLKYVTWAASRIVIVWWLPIHWRCLEERRDPENIKIKNTFLYYNIFLIFYDLLYYKY